MGINRLMTLIDRPDSEAELAIAIEFVNVIVRKSAVDRSFAGGLDAFARQDLANLTEDDHLLRVGFMSTADALDFVSELKAAGLRHLGPEADSDIAVVTGNDSALPSWLSVGSVNGHAACWASGFPAGEVVFAEPGFLLRCSRDVYRTLRELVCKCEAKVHELSVEGEQGLLEKLRCIRGDAEITIEVLGEPHGDSSVGLWGRRDLARRRQFRADVALIRDLISLLVEAGASEK